MKNITRWLVTTLLALPMIGQAQFPKNPYNGLLYWDSYWYQQSLDVPMNEEVWKANADWVAQNLAQSGYKVVAADGWIEKSTVLNPNGYVIKHNDNWDMGWSGMAAYLAAEKNSAGESTPLQFGVYYNPWWISPTAVQNPSAYKVVGTNYTVASLTDSTYSGTGGPGDRFGGGMYWLQAENPGAEQFVKGYVDYFARQGVKYLRIDFVSTYECGCNHGRMVGKSHEKYYANVLKWTYDEAVKDGIFLSIVMPNLWMADGSYKPGNPLEGFNERMYGHSIRVNEDAGSDDWASYFSGYNKGQRTTYWSQFSNAIDGLVYWSRYAGKGKIILDADFRQLASSTNDERMTKMSYMIMSGSPIGVTDSVDADGVASAGLTATLPYYTNPELVGLAGLRAEGFVGYPLINYQHPGSATTYADPTNPAQAVVNQTWVGNAANGDLIVALFNRDDVAEVRSVSFATDLGLPSGTFQVHDMWAHKDLGPTSSYSATVNAHGVVMLRIRSRTPAPTLSLAPSTFSIPQSVTITDSAAGASIYYTTDGSTPSTSSTKYTNAILVAISTALKAIAVAPGMSNSIVASGSYVITTEPPVSQ